MIVRSRLASTIVTSRSSWIAERVCTNRPMTRPRSTGDQRLVDQIGGGLVEFARRGDEPVEPVEGMFDDADRPLRPAIVFGQVAAQRFERLADDRDRGLEGVRVVFRRLADFGGGAVDRVDHAVEFGGDLAELGHVGARAERPGVRPLLANSPRPPGKAAQPAAHARAGSKR